jgi:hypothetical protein
VATAAIATLLPTLAVTAAGEMLSEVARPLTADCPDAVAELVAPVGSPVVHPARVPQTSAHSMTETSASPREDAATRPPSCPFGGRTGVA